MTNEVKVNYEVHTHTDRGGDFRTFSFDGETTVATVQIPLKLTADDIENIIVGAFEGGINYWGTVKRKNAEGETINELFGGKPIDMPFSQWCTFLLLNGKSITIQDIEDREAQAELTLEKLVKGVELTMASNHPYDLDSADVTTYDCIIQYAVFGELVYG